MVIAGRCGVGVLTKGCAVLVAVVAVLASSGCRRGCGYTGGDNGEKIEKVGLGEVRIGAELEEFYIAYAYDAAILGFSPSTGAGPRRYFPMFASTYRGVPPVVLEVFASKSEAEIWVRSSWPDNEMLAYHRIGTETATTAWGEMHFLKEPMPDRLGGEPIPFPELIMKNVVKKATFKHD